MIRNQSPFNLPKPLSQVPEPRLGLAWDPFGKSKTVVRAGFGIYRALPDSIDYRLTQTAPFNAVQAIRNVPLASLPVVPGAPLAAGSLIAPSGIQPDPHTPTVVSYTLKIEQQIAPDTSLAIGYAGSHGYHQILSVDANEPVPTICPAAPCPSNLAAGTVYYPSGAPFANPKLANSTMWITAGSSSYNALTVDLNRRFRQGFQLRGVYTFSKNLDNGTALNSSVGANAPGFVMFPGNLKLDWGLSNTDVRNLAAVHGSFDLPFGPGKKFWGAVKGWREKLTGGWSVSTIETLQSGFPFTPQLGFNPSNNGDTRNPIRPSLNPAFQGKVVRGRPVRYYDPNAFVLPPPGTYGDSGRNTLIGPGFTALDISLLKTTALTERVRLQFRGEFFNILNRANFGTPNTIVFSSASSVPSQSAGVITSTAGTSRQIQFGLKLSF